VSCEFSLKFMTSLSWNIQVCCVGGRWFSPGTPAFSTTKTGRYDITEILLKVALNTKNQSINQFKSAVCSIKY